MEPLKPVFSFDLGSLKIDIAPEIVVQWFIMLAIILFALWITKDLALRPSKKQATVEYAYEFLKSFGASNLGEKNLELLPFIGTMFIYLLLMNLMGLFGLPVPTKNFSVTLSMGLISFFMIQYYPIKKHGFKKYFKGYAFPAWIVTPINILERIILPVSLALRMFGNVFAATLLVELAYEALEHTSIFLAIGIPVPLHAYFDIFDGFIQTTIFVILTMINIKIITEHSDPEAEH